VNSSISLPGCMSHASIPAEVRQARSLATDLVRLSVGIEDVDDLLADLGRAFERAACGVATANGAAEVREQQFI
jgi:cysteine-S-conjugate beta-lyase